MAQDRAEFPLGMSDAAIAAHDLYRFYHTGDDETLALRGVSLSVTGGEMVAIVGPSGSGKSTLLAILAGLDEPDGGYVSVGAQRMTRRPEAERAALRAQTFGILLQSGNLIGHLSVVDNLRLQLALARTQRAGAVDETLAAVGLEGRAQSLPAQLSGGERARAGLAVALVAQPRILLADEPTGEVDAQTEKIILALFTNWVGAGRTVIVATHSAAVAACANRVVALRDGRIVGA